MGMQTVQQNSLREGGIMITGWMPLEMDDKDGLDYARHGGVEKKPEQKDFFDALDEQEKALFYALENEVKED
jgi:hypothetical protein